MAKSRFNIKGTKDFLVAAVFCGFVCLWSIRDAWFPTEKILKKHPHEIEVSFKVPGFLKQFNVSSGDEVSGTVPLASLYEESYRQAVASAEAAFASAKATRDPEIEKALDALTQAKENLASCTMKVSDFTWETTHGEEALRGTVCRLIAPVATHVEAGAPVMTITPNDSFYLFNKTLSVLAFIGMVVSLIFHRIASH